MPFVHASKEGFTRRVALIGVVPIVRRRLPCESCRGFSGGSGRKRELRRDWHTLCNRDATVEEWAIVPGRPYAGAYFRGGWGAIVRQMSPAHYRTGADSTACPCRHLLTVRRGSWGIGSKVSRLRGPTRYPAPRRPFFFAHSPILTRKDAKEQRSRRKHEEKKRMETRLLVATFIKR
jgi:hypothetical protein